MNGRLNTHDPRRCGWVDICECGCPGGQSGMGTMGGPEPQLSGDGKALRPSVAPGWTPRRVEAAHAIWQLERGGGSWPALYDVSRWRQRSGGRTRGGHGQNRLGIQVSRRFSEGHEYEYGARAARDA